MGLTQEELSKFEYGGLVILDIGCLRSVVGIEWVLMHIRFLKAHGEWFKLTPEAENFRFGDGHRRVSKFLFEFEAGIFGRTGVLSFSVVMSKCPPLLSRPACSKFGPEHSLQDAHSDDIGA